jgi:alpha-1,2-mannosyltransferase
VYPPLVAYLMQPLARVPFSSIARAWTAASILFVLTGLYLVATVYAPAWNGRVAWAVALLVLCAFEPIRYGFWLGQTTAVIFPLVIGSIALERRGKPELAGVALGVAAFIKLTPALVAVFWLWRGPRRAVASFMATLAALWSVSVVALGIQPHVDYVQRLRTISGADVVAYNNHSLVAFLSRFSFAPSAWQDWRMWPAPAVAAGGALLLCALIAGTVIATARDDERWRRRAEAVVFVLMLLAPNIAWTHYFVFLIPGIVVLAADARGLDAAVAAAAVALCSRPFIAAQQQAPAATNAVAVAAPTFAALLIAAALLQDQLRTNREHRMAT